MRVLQTLALPLGYSAVFVPDIFYAQRPVLIPTEEKFGADYEARTRYLHLGKVALYQMS